MSDFLSPAINDVLKGDDMDERLRELFFRSAGGISNMANDEIAEAKRIFLDTIEKAKPKNMTIETALGLGWVDNEPEAYNWALEDFEKQLKKEIGK